MQNQKKGKIRQVTVTIKGQIMHKGSRDRERDEDEERNNDFVRKVT